MPSLWRACSPVSGAGRPLRLHHRSFLGYNWTIATRKEDLDEHELMRRQEEFLQQMAGQPQGQ